MITLAQVTLWSTPIGVVALREGQDYAAFEYEPSFLPSGIEVAPITMPLHSQVYRFPQLSYRAFAGLPGLLAESLPDRFGNRVLDVWLATQGRTADSLNAIERLCYIGSRGMGALEYTPVYSPKFKDSKTLEVDHLVELASQMLADRSETIELFEDNPEPMLDILRVGTSAGGARAKAIIAWNPTTNKVCSGQIRAGDGFEYWLMKFDGIPSNGQSEHLDPHGYGAIEYAYYLMARDAGIIMSESRLFEENSRRHFMTKRFDRLDNGDKLHMQSLGSLVHSDYNVPGGYSYDQTFQILQTLKMSTNDLEQLYRRMVFNILAENRDDHVKNIAFLMNRKGKWSLAPAYDLVYAFDPSNKWISQHQMTINGKRDNITLEDLDAVANSAGIKKSGAREIISEVQSALERWKECAGTAGVLTAQIKSIQKAIQARSL